MSKYLRQIGFIYLIPFAFYLIDPFGKGFLFGYVLILVLLLNGKRLVPYLDSDFVFLSLFAISYALFYALDRSSGVQLIFIYAFFPGFFYLFGKYLAVPNLSTSKLVLLFFGIGFVFSFSALISVLLDLRTGGFVQLSREIPMVWNGEPKKATLMSAYLTFNMCLPIIYLIKQRKIPLVLQVLAGGVFVASLLSVFRLGSRTQLVITVLAIIISFLFVVPRQTIKANTKLFFFMILVVAFVLKFVPLNLDADYFSVLGSRLQESKNTSSAGGRTELWLQALENLFSHPLGWRGSHVRFAHNLWLDVARFAGVIPFFLLLIFTGRSLRNTYKAIRKDPEKLFLNTTMLIFTLAAMLVFFVEPVMEGLFYLFTVYCLYQGIINQYLIQSKSAGATGQ